MYLPASLLQFHSNGLPATMEDNSNSAKKQRMMGAASDLSMETSLHQAYAGSGLSHEGMMAPPNDIPARRQQDHQHQQFAAPGGIPAAPIMLQNHHMQYFPYGVWPPSDGMMQRHPGQHPSHHHLVAGGGTLSSFAPLGCHLSLTLAQRQLLLQQDTIAALHRNRMLIMPPSLAAGAAASMLPRTTLSPNMEMQHTVSAPIPPGTQRIS